MKLPLHLILVLMMSFGCSSPAAKEIKPEIDFYNLTGKTPEQIGQIYGRPSETETITISNHQGELRYYDRANAAPLRVDYLNGVAVAIYYPIPADLWSTSAEETLKTCGLKISTENAMFDEKATWWLAEAAKPFASVRIVKVVSGNPYRTAAYGRCEVRSV